MYVHGPCKKLLPQVSDLSLFFLFHALFLSFFWGWIRLLYIRVELLRRGGQGRPPRTSCTRSTFRLTDMTSCASRGWLGRSGFSWVRFFCHGFVLRRIADEVYHVYIYHMIFFMSSHILTAALAAARYRYSTSKRPTNAWYKQ